MSFRLKTIIGVALIEGCLLLLLVWSGMRYLTESTEEQLVLRAQVIAESMANLTKDAILASDLARLDSVARQILHSPDLVYVRISDSETILAAVGDPEALDRAFTADRSFDSANDGVFDVGVDIQEEGFVYGRIELGLSIDRARLLIEAARRHLAGIALGEMVLVALFSYILGTYLTRGLENLAYAARAISTGSLYTQVRVKGKDELAQTGEAFNAMARRLAESHREMQRSVEESQAMAARLADRELRLLTVLDTAVDGFITIDEKGIIETANPAAVRLFGYEHSELLGRNISCLMPEPHSARHDDYVSRYLASGVPAVIGRGRRVYGLKKDGSTFPMDLAVSEMVLNGRHTFVGLVRDLGEQFRVESAARKSEAMRTAIVDANLDGLITIDQEDRIVEFSRVAEQIFGHRRDEVLGRPMAELIIPPETREMHRRGMEHYFKSGEGPVLGNRIEVQALRADGARFPVELAIQPITVDDETYFSAMIRDISDRKNEEQALRDAKQQAEVASEAKSRFLAHMSHEIRSPLNAVLGSLALLLDEGLDRDQRLYAKTAESSGKVLLSVINDVLDFSKIEAGQLDLEEVDFDLRALVSEVMDLVTFRAREKNLYVAGVVDAGVPGGVNGDMSRLRQVLSNLLDNAIKFTENGGVVLRVKQGAVTATGVQLCFTVEDSGIGIPSEAQATLFEEFQQVDSSDSTHYGGTGLGLSICRGLVALMGGEISVDSSPGAGSRFRVALPLRALPSTAASGQHSLVGNCSVLAVGFPPLIASALAGLGESIGCAVELLALADDGVPRLRSRFDTVLVDGSMPAEDLDRLSAAARAVGVPRLLLVAPSQSRDRARRVVDGQFDDLLLVPLVESVLLDGLAVMHPVAAVVTAMPPAGDSDIDTGAEGRLLLVEDSVANQLVARAMLEDAGYAVDIANNGAEAVKMFSRSRYRAVLMDLRMPAMDGLAATAAIRGLAGGEDVPIIAMTANAMQQDVDRCRDAGMDDFVSKPVDKRKLLDTLTRQLNAGGTRAGSGDGGGNELSDGDATPLLDDRVLLQLAADVSQGAIPGMMQMFVKETVERADKVTAALRDASLGILEDEAHTLKSCAGTFGAQRLQLLARKIETACREGKGEVAIELGATVPQVLRDTLAVYRERFPFLAEEQERR